MAFQDVEKKRGCAGFNPHSLLSISKLDEMNFGSSEAAPLFQHHEFFDFSLPVFQ